MDKQNLINAWIVYDKGNIYDGGTGENDRPATKEEIQEAGLYIENFIKQYQEPQLDSDIDGAIEYIENLFVKVDIKYPIEYRRLKWYPKAKGKMLTIKQALVDKDIRISQLIMGGDKYLKERNKLQTELDKITKAIDRHDIHNDRALFVSRLKQILKEEK